MARAKQVVVVGDDKQLPPTRFFSKMLDEDELAEDSDDDLNAGDLESILGPLRRPGDVAADAPLALPQPPSFADRRLEPRVLREPPLRRPEPDDDHGDARAPLPPRQGRGLRPGEHGDELGGGQGDRRRGHRAREDSHPKKSLGVGAFSVAQRDAIRDELEVLQREHVELAAFFSPGRPEPFFVKNLENIQGDERDVIFISVGYARDASGYMAMNFGPLSSQGGERRLNVLISRARERCEVFSSITADDIDLQRAKSRGAAAFKTFLRYAATGVLDTQAPTGGDYDSDFERQVALALEGLGYEVHRQVGTAGFIIDLAVVDPAQPGRYLLGIECDGATYHSSRSARDRDRLREAVLRDRGWKIHRVWSTDWFHRPGEQLQKIVAAIEKAGRDADADEEVEAAHEQVTRRSTLAEPDHRARESARGTATIRLRCLGRSLRGGDARRTHWNADSRDEPFRSWRASWRAWSRSKDRSTGMRSRGGSRRSGD